MGPFKLVNVPPVVSAEMALPPVACVNCAVLTVMAGLVLAVLLPSVRSLAMRVKLPLVLKKTWKFCVPDASAALAGRVAVESLAVIPTRSVTVFTRFQLASTALTVTVNPVKALCGAGAPLFPEAVPGAADSPGTRSWSLAKKAGLTTTLAEVALVKLPLLKPMFIVSATG